MNLTVFYHCWEGGQWQAPHLEFQSALASAGFKGDVVINWSRATSEAPTINMLRGYAQAHDGAVLYAHTKGAATVEEFRDRWRASMTNHVVRRWRENLTLLESVDAVGCHWLTEEAFPGMFQQGMTDPHAGSGFFGGNFWMARCDYLRNLPRCRMEPRWEAERWIGHGRPRVVDLLPGWPHDRRWPELCE